MKKEAYRTLKPRNVSGHNNYGLLANFTGDLNKGTHEMKTMDLRTRQAIISRSLLDSPVSAKRKLQQANSQPRDHLYEGEIFHSNMQEQEHQSWIENLWSVDLLRRHMNQIKCDNLVRERADNAVIDQQIIEDVKANQDQHQARKRALAQEMKQRYLEYSKRKEERDSVHELPKQEMD